MLRTVGEIMTNRQTAAQAATEGRRNAEIDALPHHHHLTALASHDLSCLAKSGHRRNRPVSVKLILDGCIPPLQIPAVLILDAFDQGTDRRVLMDTSDRNSLLAQHLDIAGADSLSKGT
jgi:hypothetical protein